MWSLLEFNQHLQAYNKLKSLTGLYHSESHENSKKTKFYCINVIDHCNYTSMAWIQNGFSEKINLCNTYVNEIYLKYLNKYWNLLKLYFIGEYHCCIQFHFMEYNYIFNTPKDRNEFLFFQLGLTPCKADQPLQGMELQEKEAQKD